MVSGSSTKDIPTDVAEAWQELCEKDDRTSPAEHPDMCLITRDELLGYMSLASAEDERRGIAEIRMDERHKYLWQVRDTCTRAEAAEAALKAAREALEGVDGCFEAALVEGWADALASGDIERITDLFNRRIVYARTAAVAALTPKEP